MKAKETTLAALQQERTDEAAAHEATKAELIKARQDVTRAKLEQERLTNELGVARSRIDQSAEALRTELQRMEEAAEEAAQAQAQWRREAQRRQTQLEEANAQLSQVRLVFNTCFVFLRGFAKHANFQIY